MNFPFKVLTQHLSEVASVRYKWFPESFCMGGKSNLGWIEPSVSTVTAAHCSGVSVIAALWLYIGRQLP